MPRNVDECMNKLEIGRAIDEVFEVLRKSNKYIDDTAPWTLAKDEAMKDRLETVLYHLLESIRICAFELSPFMPETSEKIFKQLNSTVKNNEFNENGSYVVSEPVPLFLRIDIAKKLEEIQAKNEVK